MPVLRPASRRRPWVSGPPTSSNTNTLPPAGGDDGGPGGTGSGPLKRFSMITPAARRKPSYLPTPFSVVSSPKPFRQTVLTSKSQVFLQRRAGKAIVLQMSARPFVVKLPPNFLVAKSVRLQRNGTAKILRMPTYVAPVSIQISPFLRSTRLRRSSFNGRVVLLVAPIFIQAMIPVPPNLARDFDIQYLGPGMMGTSVPVPVGVKLNLRFSISGRDGNAVDVPVGATLSVLLPNGSEDGPFEMNAEGVEPASIQIVSCSYLFSVAGFYSMKILVPEGGTTPGYVAHLYCED